MGQDPDQIRQDIESTRADMGVSLDEIGDRVSPGRAVQRRKERVRGRWQSVRERVMGSNDDAPSQTSSSAGGSRLADAKDSAQQVPEQVRQQTQGNPLLAGALAFGAGVLASSLLPPSNPEQQAAAVLQEKAEPLKQQAKEAASEVGSQVADAAKDAKDQLGEQAKDSADLVKGEAQAKKDDLRDEAQSHADEVKQQTSAAAGEVKGNAKSSAESVKDSGGS